VAVMVLIAFFRWV